MMKRIAAILAAMLPLLSSCATQEERLSLAMVDSLRARPADERVRLMSSSFADLPWKLPARVGAMDVPTQASELARLLDETEGIYSRSSARKAFAQSDPAELQFSCAITYDPHEDLWHKLLKCESSDVSAVAAQVLWRGHSRRYARQILRAAARDNTDGPAWNEARQLIEQSLQPEMILKEINGNDRSWGLWLAALRPDASLVPALLAAHEREPTDHTTYALGASRDARAYEPLIAQFRTGDYRTSGQAAQALGLLGMPEAEAALLERLDGLGPWPQAKACTALGKIGSGAAIDQLELLALPRYTGAINVSRCAAIALEQIRQRQTDRP